MAIMDATDFKARFPQFAANPDEQINLLLNDAETLYHDPDRWGVQQKRAVALRVAHWLTLERDEMAIAVAQGAQATTGGGNASHASPVLDDDLTLTHYGRLLRGMINDLVGFGGIVA